MAEDEAEGAGEGPAGSTSSIIVVDPDPASRSLAEDLEDDFDRQVIAMDSTDFDVDGSEEILEADTLILCWDLGIRSGADLLEQVRHDPLLAQKTVLIAMDAPTPASVRTAIQLGADSVCMKPYCADEIAKALERASAKRMQQAA